MSEANRVSLKYIAEATYGVTPGTGNWQAARFTGHTLAAAPKTEISKELRSDRMVSDLALVGQEVTGDVNVELSCTSYDDWFQAALQGAWASNVLKVGTTKRSFSIETAMLDWASVRYLQFAGMRVAGFNFKFAHGAIVEGGFKFAGKTAAESGTTLVVTGTTAATTTDVLNGASGISAIQIDGASPGVIVKSVMLELDNTLRPITGVGAVGPQDQLSGRSMITGTLEVYFDDIALYTKLLNNTSFALNWTVGDGSKSYTFRITKAKFNEGNPPVTGVDTDVMLSLKFTALYDATDTSLKITRVP